VPEIGYTQRERAKYGTLRWKLIEISEQIKRDSIEYNEDGFRDTVL
jgi:hypothetical protein